MEVQVLSSAFGSRDGKQSRPPICICLLHRFACPELEPRFPETSGFSLTTERLAARRRKSLDAIRKDPYSSSRTRVRTPHLGGIMLTARQQEIWQFLVEYTDGHGYPPTVREIGEAVGLASPSTVHAHLANLERAGLLKRDPSKPRALDLIGHRTVAAPAPRAGVEEMHRLPAARPDRSRLAAARRGERRGPHRRARAARPQRRLPAHGPRRLDDRSRHPRRRHARRPQAGGRVERRHRRGARRRRRERRRGDREDLLPRERPHPAAAREQRARADLRRLREVIGKVVGVFRSLR